VLVDSPRSGRERAPDPARHPGLNGQGEDGWGAPRWAQVLGALVGAVDLVLVGSEARVRPGDQRRLAARARERGTTLVHVGGAGRDADAPDLRLTATGVTWQGLGRGHGHLRARQVHLEVTGRRRAARSREVDLWLPDPDGRVTPVEPAASISFLVRDSGVVPGSRTKNRGG
jgi:hypothetical protein